jgi:hypothetical protein
VTSCPDEQALLAWRGTGCNLLLAPAGEATAPLWDLADRLGFLVLGRVADGSEGNAAFLARLNARPSCHGWLVRPGAVAPGLLPPGSRVGLDLDAVPAQPPPDGISFVACAPERLGAWPAETGLPVLVLGGEAAWAEVRQRDPAPALLGWVE